MLIPRGATVVDIGSGAGLPGVPLAIARPDLTVVLVESMLRRTTFLSEVVADLGLDSVLVRRARAEELATQLSSSELADVVTARAVAPIDKLARWALPLAKDRGVVLALKGAGAAEEVTAAWRSLQRHGVAEAQLVSLTASASAPSGTLEIDVEELAGWPTSTPPRLAPGGESVAIVLALSRFPWPSPQAPGLV